MNGIKANEPSLLTISGDGETRLSADRLITLSVNDSNCVVAGTTVNRRAGECAPYWEAAYVML